VVRASGLTKDFRIARHRPGFLGAVRGLLSPEATIVRAVDHVCFDIEPGELVGYIGPNGAGKSTSIKMLTGILTPTEGTVRVGGRDPHRQRRENAARMGVVFGQRTHLWWDLPVIESFELLRHMYRVPLERYRENLDTFNDLLELSSFFPTPVRQLSLGQRMRADIAAALLHDPEVLFLDEPTIGLDVIAKQRVRQFVQTINRERGVTILLTTHDVSDVERLCRRVIVIDHARIIHDGPLTDLRARTDSHRVITVDFAGDYETVGVANAQLTERDGRRATYRVDKDAAPAVIAHILSTFSVEDLAVHETEIEEVIRRLYEERAAGE